MTATRSLVLRSLHKRRILLMPSLQLLFRAFPRNDLSNYSRSLCNLFYCVRLNDIFVKNFDTTLPIAVSSVKFNYNIIIVIFVSFFDHGSQLLH